MDLAKLKFNESDFIGKDVASLPDRVVGRAEYLKKMFDNVAKNEIALGRFNQLVDKLDKMYGMVSAQGEPNQSVPSGVQTYLKLSALGGDNGVNDFGEDASIKDGTKLWIPAGYKRAIIRYKVYLNATNKSGQFELTLVSYNQNLVALSTLDAVRFYADNNGASVSPEFGSTWMGDISGYRAFEMRFYQNSGAAMTTSPTKFRYGIQAMLFK